MKRYMLTDVGLKEVTIRFRVVNDRLQNWCCVCDTKTQHGQYEVEGGRFERSGRSFSFVGLKKNCRLRSKASAINSDSTDVSRTANTDRTLSSLKLVIERQRKKHSNGYSHGAMLLTIFELLVCLF
jgi:hypothetical protein